MDAQAQDEPQQPQSHEVSGGHFHGEGGGTLEALGTLGVRQLSRSALLTPLQAQPPSGFLRKRQAVSKLKAPGISAPENRF